MSEAAAGTEAYWAGLPLGAGVAVLTHDANGLAALSKPAMVRSHPNEEDPDARALLTCRYLPEGECYEWLPPGATKPVRLHLLNRLDAPTSGVILAARDETLARAVRELFQRKRVRKVYAALVFGAMPVPVQFWRDWLKVEHAAGQVRVGTGGKLMAETQATLLKVRHSNPPLTLLKLEPRTGRSHQLRVQCAEHHLPIVGDQTYGDFQANRTFAKTSGQRRLFLHAQETSFEYEWRGRSHFFTARMNAPPEFAAALK